MKECINNYLQQYKAEDLVLFTKLFSIIFAILLLFNFYNQYRFFRTSPQKVYAKKVKILGLFYLPDLSEKQFLLLGFTLLLSLMMIAFGIYTKLFIAIALLSYFSYYSSIIKLDYIQRKTNLLPFILIVLLLSPALNKDADTSYPSWEILLIKIGIVQMYLSSGIQKLKHSGIKWCNGYSLQAYLLENYLWNEKKTALIISKKRWLCSLLSWLTLLFELGFVFIIFFPSLTYLFVTLAFLFHWGTYISMRINYLKYLLPVYMIFFTDPFSVLLKMWNAL